MAKEITISGEIGWDVSAKDVKDQFSAIKPTDEVEVHINTPGGSVFQGISISQMIKGHKGKTTTIVDGIAASMGSYLLMAGDVRKAHDDSSFMVHNALVEFIRGGDHRFLRKLANTLESLTKMLAKAYAKVTGQSETEIRDMMDETTWLFGDEIKDAGFVDEIIESESPEDKEDALAFQKLAFDECISNIRKRDNQDDQKKDVVDLVAFFNKEPAKLPVKKPSNHGENMTFEEFLAKFPEEAKRINAWLEASEKEKTQAMSLTDVMALAPLAKTEHEQLIATATTEAKTELDADKLSEADARYIATIIGSEAYQGNKAVVDVGIDTFAGKNDMKNFRTIVAMADQNAEQIKSMQIKSKQPAATGAEEHDLEGNDSVKSPKIQANIANLKQNLNV